MRLLRSFAHAFAGLFFVARHERNFRIHVVIACYVLYFSRFYRLSRAEYLILILLFALVLAAEGVNTAIEQTVNIKTKEWNEQAKRAKDVAAGAALISACASVICGIVLFWDTAVFRVIWEETILQPLNCCFFLLSLIAAWAFIQLIGDNHERH